MLFSTLIVKDHDTSRDYAVSAASITVRLSVGKAGGWDTVVAESFFSTLKRHLLYDRQQFPSKQQARFETPQWRET